MYNRGDGPATSSVAGSTTWAVSEHHSLLSAVRRSAVFCFVGQLWARHKLGGLQLPHPEPRRLAQEEFLTFPFVLDHVRHFLGGCPGWGVDLVRYWRCGAPKICCISSNRIGSGVWGEGTRYVADPVQVRSKKARLGHSASNMPSDHLGAAEETLFAGVDD